MATARRSTRVSSKHQVTIPRDAFVGAGLRPGDRLEAEAQGPGAVLLVRADTATARHAGALKGVYHPGELDELRGEWD
jgi:bifunctional DNA-binding transcriptional regulator/antitoxin component of YhaV-PrlF toxin-antitoxin module